MLGLIAIFVGFGSHISEDVGPGAALASHEHKRSEDHISLSVGGQLGIEYNFDAPIQLSIDARPMWDILGNDHGLGWGAALGIRYTW